MGLIERKIGMKKIVAFTSLILLTVFVLPVLAAYVGAPITSEKKEQWSFSLEGNIIGEKDLEISGSTLELESNQFGVKGNYTFDDGFNFFYKLGMAEWDINDSESGIKTEVCYDMAPYFGLGMRASTEMGSEINLTTDLQYIFQSGVDVDSVTFEGERGYNIRGADADITDFQLSMLVSKTFEMDSFTIVPYTGPYYQKFTFKLGNFYFETDTWYISSSIKNELEGKYEIGAILGLTFVVSKTLEFNIESRFAAEQAFSLGAGYKF